MGSRVDDRLEQSIQRLFPNVEPDQALAELLLERAQRNMIRYQTMMRQYEGRYAQSFEEFRRAMLTSHPDDHADERSEQDYFDWELAITGIADMQEEIAYLSGLFAAP